MIYQLSFLRLQIIAEMKIKKKLSVPRLTEDDGPRGQFR